MNFDIAYVVQAVVGIFAPWFINFVKSKNITWLQGARTLQVIVGVVGMITAIVADPILSSLGVATSKSIQELVFIGWGITAPISELSYRTFFKEKKNG